MGTASSEADEPDLLMSSCVAQPPCNLIPDRAGCLRGGLKHSSCPGTHNRLEIVRARLLNLFLPLLLGRKHRGVSSHRQRRLALLFHLLSPRARRQGSVELPEGI